MENSIEKHSEKNSQTCRTRKRFTIGIGIVFNQEIFIDSSLLTRAGEAEGFFFKKKLSNTTILVLKSKLSCQNNFYLKLPLS